MDAKTRDNSTYATLPGQCHITRADYARYFGRSFVERRWRYLSSFLPFAWHRIPLLNGGLNWLRMKEWFQYGDTNPTIVLDSKRRLVATYTALDTGLQHRFTVIRVIGEKLQLIRGGVHDGQRFASVSSYRRGKDSERLGRWETFTPIVIDCMSRDAELCEKMKARIPASHWTALEIGLKQISHPPKAGLYDIVLPEDLRRLL
ncbi:hypothetical protein CfE428DRAFT_3427 [Chthoniobacter flavus Ellin428]|uniref:Uncharacterized protein n=2 Tax=Chthoniobacter flavus TaxID=191863 RepID=B4D3D9_9BACT|nr:hypothetical protein CfE428DRAFT_3427 [Chthoniobacter flavus Ellin428]TCO88093.1 uncharacterized protein DUF3239 [Chthoniobacter flavus]